MASKDSGMLGRVAAEQRATKVQAINKEYILCVAESKKGNKL